MRSTFVLLAMTAVVPAWGQLLIEDNHALQRGLDGAPGERSNNDLFGFDTVGGDFDGDGYSDLAVGSPGYDNGRGLITVYPGGPFGFEPARAKEIRQGADGLDGSDERGDLFGSALAAGDFDNDGYWDLAVGVRGEDNLQGIIQVLYGSQNGLTGDRDQVWSQSDLEGSGRDAGDQFGWAVTSGDFNGDGYADVVVGSPGEAQQAGVLHVIYGSASGLTASGNQRWRQGADGLQSNRESGDLFGYELAAGDFNGDGADDLAVAVPGEDNAQGGVAILFGAVGGGLVSTGNLFLHQGERGLPERRENADAFGEVLTTGDFNRDGYADLVAVSLNEDNGRGVVIVVPGSQAGLTGEGSVDWRQGQAGLQEEQENGDRFGTSVIAGDFDGDGFGDLAVGARGEDANRGLVQVIYGSASGLTADGNDLFQQGFEGLVGEASAGDDFGSSLAVGNFGFDAAQDLAMGAPREEGGQDRGSVYVLYGYGLAVVSAGGSVPSVTDAAYNSILTAFGPGFAAPGTAALGRLVNGRLETNVGGVCVEMNGRRTPIFATFEHQVNFQADVAPDQRQAVATVISNCGQPNERRSLPIPIRIAQAAPEFFFFQPSESGRNPVAAIDNATGELLAAPGAIPGAVSRRARGGDVVTVFLTGLGDTNPRFAPGELPAVAGRAAAPVTIEVGGRVYQPEYAGVTPGNAGLYQVSFVLAPGGPTGDLDVRVTVQTQSGPVATPAGAYLSVQ